MPTLGDFLARFGWPEFWITFLITAIIAGIRERHHFFKADANKHPDIKSME